MRWLFLKERRTCRRQILDEAIARVRLVGTVLDIGGEVATRRGAFNPDRADLRRLITVNIDRSVRPDALCTAGLLPLASGSIDTVLCTEVLEHVRDAEAAVGEAARVLRADGLFYGSMPFMFAVHGDPYDFQRWAPSKIRDVFARSGFCAVDVTPMGGIWSVTWDAFHVSLSARCCVKPRSLRNRVLRFLLRSLRPMAMCLDRSATASMSAVTTGYFIVAQKKAD